MNINRESWEVLLGLKKLEIPSAIPSYVKTNKTKEDEEYISEKNFYVYSESFVNDIKELLSDFSLKPKQMYDILLEQKKIPITKYGKIMTRNTFQGYVIGIRAELGQESRPYTRSASVRRLLDEGVDDPLVIAKQLNMEIGYVREIRRKYLKDKNVDDLLSIKNTIKSKIPAMVVMYTKDKKSTVEIAKILNLSTNTINRNLLKNGVKLRSKKDYFNSKKVA